MKGRPDSRRREGCEAEDRDWTLCGRKHRREAEEVVARIQEIGGEEVQVDPLLLVRSYLEKGDYHGVRRWCLAWLAEHEAASADEARPFVDALICSMEPGDPAGDAPTTSSIRDAAAIRQAITALGQGRFNEVLGRIRAIGASSPCNSWKLVLKALCAYYRRDESRARALLRAVPADSSLHNIAAVWDVLAGNEDVLETRFRDSAFLGQVCTAAGIRELRDVAVRCEYLWRVNRRRPTIFCRGTKRRIESIFLCTGSGNGNGKPTACSMRSSNGFPTTPRVRGMDR
jgi:hypothetical protein